MAIREDLARRLVEVLMKSMGGKEVRIGVLTPGGKIQFSAPQDPDKFPDPQPFYDLTPLADECIRQMEWARRGSHKGWACPHGYTGATGAHQFCECFSEYPSKTDLSLAPEDWQYDSPSNREDSEMPTGDEPGFSAHHRLAAGFALIEMSRVGILDVAIASDERALAYMAQLLANFERRGAAKP